MFTRHRLGPANKLDCPHAMGTDAFSRIMIPRLPPSTALRASAKRDFGSGLRRPPGASTFCCYHRPIRLLCGARSLRALNGHTSSDAWKPAKMHRSFVVGSSLCEDLAPQDDRRGGLLCWDLLAELCSAGRTGASAPSCGSGGG